MGLRPHLLLLVLLPAIPALLLALYTNLQVRKLSTAKVEKDAMKVVQLAAASQNGLMEATRAHLAGLSRFPEARGTNTAAFNTFFVRLNRVYTNYADFGKIIRLRLNEHSTQTLADRMIFCKYNEMEFKG